MKNFVILITVVFMIALAGCQRKEVSNNPPEGNKVQRENVVYSSVYLDVHKVFIEGKTFYIATTSEGSPVVVHVNE